MLAIILQPRTVSIFFGYFVIAHLLKDGFRPLDAGLTFRFYHLLTDCLSKLDCLKRILLTLSYHPWRSCIQSRVQYRSLNIKRQYQITEGKSQDLTSVSFCNLFVSHKNSRWNPKILINEQVCNMSVLYLYLFLPQWFVSVFLVHLTNNKAKGNIKLLPFTPFVFELQQPYCVLRIGVSIINTVYLKFPQFNRMGKWSR